MKHTNLFALIAIGLATFSLTACGSIQIGSGNIVVGSGISKSEKRNVSGFSSVSLANSGDVTISVTGEDSLIVEADDNILPLLTNDVMDNHLTLNTRSNTSIQPRSAIKYTLTVKQLDDVQLTGSGTITVNDLAESDFKSDLSGSGHILAHGKVSNLGVTVSGSGNFNGSDLDSHNVTAAVSGSGEILVKASDNLNASIPGSGIIRYIGNPTVTKSISGSGSVTQQ